MVLVSPCGSYKKSQGFRVSAKSIIQSCFGHVPWCLVQNTVIAIRCEYPMGGGGYSGILVTGMCE